MGVGDELTHVEAGGSEDSALNLVMVASPTGLSTPAVFAELDAGREQNKYPAPGELNVPEELLEALTSTGAPIARLHEISRYLRNDLQQPALTLQPELAKTLGFQDAQIVASFVSGSGPTIALLMESEADAEALAKSLCRRGRYAVAVKTPAEG
jgi:4-diphosphocytidyl-2-C-methyl-D-erythritol kinase